MNSKCHYLVQVFLISLGFFMTSESSMAGIFDSISASETATQPFDFIADPVNQAENFVEVTGASNFAEIKKIGIINFNIEFTARKDQFNLNQSASWKSGAAANSTKYKGHSLPQPDSRQLQVIVDNAYAELLQMLKTKGIEIAAYRDLQNLPAFQDFKRSLHVSPWVKDTEDSSSIFVAPTGMSLYMDNKDRVNLSQQMGGDFTQQLDGNFPQDINSNFPQQMGGNFPQDMGGKFPQPIGGSFANANAPESQMMFTLQDMSLLSVNMVVEFSNAEDDQNLSANPLTGGKVHHVLPKSTSFRFIGDGQTDWIRAQLKSPLVSDKIFWTEVQEDANKEKPKNEGKGGFFGSVFSGSSAVTEYSFDMPVYYERSKAMILATQKMFIGMLEKYRR
jgi:hypothetical protein